MAPHRKRLISAVIPTNQAVEEKNECTFPFSCAGIWFPHLRPGNQRTATAGERKRRRQAAADAVKPLHAAGFSVRINEAPARVSFNFLAEHYLKADFGADAVRPKSVNTIGHVEQVVRAYLIPRFGDEIAEDIKPFDIQRWLKSLHEPGGLAWTTISKMRGIMSRIYKIGILHEHVAKNPVQHVETRSKSD